MRKILTVTLVEVYAENLKTWTREVLHKALNKDEAIEELVDFYLSEDDNEQNDQDEQDDEEDDGASAVAGVVEAGSFDQEWLVADLLTYCGAVELRQVLEQVLEQRFSSVDDALGLLKFVFEQRDQPPGLRDTLVRAILQRVPAERLRAWFSDYDVEYPTKAEAIDVLVQVYSGELADQEDDEDDGEWDDYEPSLGLDEERRAFYEELARPVEAREEPLYQSEAVAAAQRALTMRPGARIQLHIATGGGKTHIANDVVWAELARGGRVLWVTKDWPLLRQAAIDLGRRHRGAPELGRIGGGHHELRVLPEGAGRVRYTTIHTLSRRKAKAFRGFSPTLAVWDECH